MLFLKEKMLLDLCDWQTVLNVQVNVVKGLKLYEDVFTDSEVSKLIEFVTEYRAAGQNGELSGEFLWLHLN